MTFKFKYFSIRFLCASPIHPNIPKLPVLSGREVVRILGKLGFERIDQRGSHAILIKKLSDRKIKVIVPLHPELKKGTLLSILKQAGLTREELGQL